jgi:hypothetical protein
MVAGAAAAAVATMAATSMRTAAAATARVTVMATAAASWTPWLKFIRVARALVQGWRPVTNLGGNPRKGGSLGQKC